MALGVAVRGDPRDKPIDGRTCGPPADSRTAARGRQTPDHRGDARSAPPSQGRESKMRAFVIATLIAAGLGLVGRTASLALPASGNAIEAAAAVNPLIEPVYWRHYYWHRWHRLAPVAPSLVIITSDNGPGVGPGPVRAIPPRPLRGCHVSMQR